MKKYLIAIAVLFFVISSCKKSSTPANNGNNNSTSPAITAAKAFLNLTFSPTKAWFSTNGTMSAPTDSTTAKTITSKIDITFIFDYNYIQPGFFDPKARAQVWYWNDFYLSWLSNSVETRYYSTNLTKTQFDAASADQSKIATYFSDASVVLAPHDIFPTGSCIGGRQSTNSMLLYTGQVWGFKNTVSGKRGLLYIRTDQYSGWPTPITNTNTKVDIIRES